MTNALKVYCDTPIQMVPISELKLNPNNRNKHPEAQIERLAAILKANGWRYPVKVSNLSGMVSTGHGRILAALFNGWKEVPVQYQDYDNPAQEFADSIADNAIASWAELDLPGINFDLPEFGPDLDIDMLGIQNFKLDPADHGLPADGQYTTKVNTPTYEIRGEKPKPHELYDLGKTQELLGEIRRKDLPVEVAQFLELAAQRHVVFNYGRIAEYYAHAPKEVQELMENSALVIIDFNKAIEKGFVKLSDHLAEAFSDEE